MSEYDTSQLVNRLEADVARLQEELRELRTEPVQNAASDTSPNKEVLPYPTHRRQVLKKLGMVVASFIGVGTAVSTSPVTASARPEASQASLTVRQNSFDTAVNTFVKFRGGVDAKQYRRRGRDLEGTVFPSNPEPGDRYFRTDRGIEYYHDGTNWLSLHPFYCTMAYNPNAFSRPLTTNFTGYQIISNPEVNYSIYIESFTLISSVTQLFDANNYWQFEMRRYFDDNIGVQLFLKSIYQPDRLLDRHYVDVIPVNTVYNKDTFKTFAVNWIKIGNPGGISEHPVTIRYRLIG